MRTSVFKRVSIKGPLYKEHFDFGNVFLTLPLSIVLLRSLSKSQKLRKKVVKFDNSIMRFEFRTLRTFGFPN